MSEFDRLVPALVLLVLGILVRWYEGSWAAPPAYFFLFWIAQVALSCVVPEYPVWSGSLWWIVLNCIMLFLGSVLIGHTLVPTLRAVKSPRVRFPLPTLVLLATSAASMTYTILVERAGMELSLI